MIGGRRSTRSPALPGGVSKGLTEEERERDRAASAAELVEFAQFTLQLFDDIVLGNQAYVDLILSDVYTPRDLLHGHWSTRTTRSNFYDGTVRVVDPTARSSRSTRRRDYLEYIAEHVEPWTYLKFPYLKTVGWKGFVDGKDSGVYCATPLARLNAADGMATPRAQEAYERRCYQTARAASRCTTRWPPTGRARSSCSTPPSGRSSWPPTRRSPSTEIRTHPDGDRRPRASASSRRPRGTLTHHYRTDERGIVTKVNLIVGTTNNYAPMSMSIKKAAAGSDRREDRGQRGHR